MQESDILPFADRMKFFEETSKGTAMPNVSNMSIHRQKKPTHRSGELSQHPKQRKFSYQGEPLQESVQSQNNIEFRRQSVSAMMERQIEMDREQVKARERELKLREKYERDLQKDTGRHRETDQEKEQEERQRAKIKQIELGKEKEQSCIKTRGSDLEGDRSMEKDEDYPLVSCQECCTNFSMAERNKGFQQIHNYPSFHASQQAFPCCHTQNQAFRSAFHLVSPPDHSVESQQPFSQKHRTRSYTPTEMYNSKQLGVSKLSRNYSLSERNYQSWSEQSNYDRHHPQQSRCHVPPPQSGPDGSHAFTPPSFLRGRAMSENDLSFDPGKHWSPQISAAASQVLTEVEEGAAPFGRDAARTTRQVRKKTPPPRPPPPKWEQYYQRRASHHALLSCADARLSTPHPFANAEGNHLPPSFACNPPPETSRQRSYSLPVERQEVSEGYQPCRCDHTKPQERGYGPAPSHQNETVHQSSRYPPPQPELLFRPVAVPHMERMKDMRVQTPASLPTPPPTTEPGASSLSSMAVLHNQDRVKLEKPKSSVRPGSDPDRTPSPKGHSNPPPPTDSFPPQSSLHQTFNEQQKQLFVSKSVPVEEQRTLSKSVPEPELYHSPSPACSLESDLNVPMETDIDDFPEEEEPPKEDGMLSSELPCFALPVTVLETDIDTLLLEPACGVRSGSRAAEEDGEPGESGPSLKELLLRSGEAESSKGHFQAEGGDTNSLERRSGASSSSSFYSTSGSTDQLFSQMKDFTDNKDWEEDNELSYKRQLLQSLRKKLGVLREAQRGLQEDIRANAQLGEEVESMVVSVCKPNEVEKFHMFIGDLDKVLSLLLSLSGRLLKVEALMDSLDPDTDHHERLRLLEKKRQLTRQLSEARDLKEHIDRREQAVSRVLGRCLTADQHKDYSHFVKMKAALLVEQRQLEDKIRLGEEQLRGLRESLGLGLGMAKGISMGFRHY
ncbi:hypothetical protein OJAV_G00180010 [Oryzias javanicus]|uniref:ASD2 domain-containing protein n=1 Tax=Oryzias javanicus TaxID=123683 RepID=A0A3S2PT62_ORYJA|nr:hypothetical protein OJAV_G00180010 [Oryzias javanicus]